LKPTLCKNETFRGKSAYYLQKRATVSGKKLQKHLYCSRPACPRRAARLRRSLAVGQSYNSLACARSKLQNENFVLC